MLFSVSIFLFIFCKMRQRLCAAYHIERGIANRLGFPEYPCACNRCRGAEIRKVDTIARHHRTHGRDPYLLYPVMVIFSKFHVHYVFFVIVSLMVLKDSIRFSLPQKL